MIKIVLADEFGIFRAGLRNLLERRPMTKVIAEGADGVTALELVRKHSPELLITEVMLPKLNGVKLTTQLRAEQPDVRVIALSCHGESTLVSAMLKAGADGYLLKRSEPEELDTAIDTVLKGKTYLSPGITAGLVEQAYPGAMPLCPFESLTPREREVVQLLAEGQSNKEIAVTLGIGVKTVESHRAGAMAKLKIHNVAGLTKYAIREGLTSIEEG